MSAPWLKVRSPFRQLLGRGRSLATYDIVAAFPGLPALLVQVLFGLACTFCGIGLRWLIDHIWAGAGPFALMVPFVLVATLFGRWQAGIVTAVLSSLHAWYFVLPITGSFSLAVSRDGPRVIVNILAAIFVVLLGELFRHTVWGALTDRDLLLREIEHRVKNNFASVASMLRLQMREHAGDPTIMTALQSALGRVESYAIVNSFLYRGTQYTGTVDMAAYLGQLCASLEKSAAPELSVRITPKVTAVAMERDHAIVIGLLVNEIVTNAVKHAFQNREQGQVTVVMKGTDERWSLEITDDGVGLTETVGEGSLGLKLISALAGQLRATVNVVSDDRGTRFTFNASKIE